MNDDELSDATGTIADALEMRATDYCALLHKDPLEVARRLDEHYLTTEDNRDDSADK